jgi:hypothetical protein
VPKEDGESMFTVIKLDPRGQLKIQYQGEMLERSPHRVVIQASWMHPTMEMGYTRFEPGDHFIEYYYSDRWFNIFDITSTSGIRKGWYCNVAEPAVMCNDYLRQIDLILDVWINPQGEPLILDEDEFIMDSVLSELQRAGAQRGLQALLQMLTAREEVFSCLADRNKQAQKTL